MSLTHNFTKNIVSPPSTIRPHWNYFLALERDFEITSRYIEFCQDNLSTYSIEFAHLLLSAASEVDAVAKCVCALVAPTEKADNINQYRQIILADEDAQKWKHKLCDIRVSIPRYNLGVNPWASWRAGDKNPEWWHSYNKVKHERNNHFNRASLHNALAALAGLLCMNYLYCRFTLGGNRGEIHSFEKKWVTPHLTPQSTFLRLEQDYYIDPIDELNNVVDQIVHGRKLGR